MKRLLLLLAVVPLVYASPAFAGGRGRHRPCVHGASCGHRHRRRRHGRRHPVRRHRPTRAPANETTTTKTETTGQSSSSSSAPATRSGAPLRRSNRMEFDARLVKGQTAQSGAVYLFQRAPRRLPPLLKLKQSYLHLIVDPVLGPDYKKKKGRHR